MSTFPYTHPSMPGTSYRDYLMPLPREMEARAYFAEPDEEPPAALPPILVTVSEEFNLRKSSRPIIHWDNVPETDHAFTAAFEAILRQALELRAKGIEPVFTLNGKVVDLAGPVNPHTL